MTFKPEVTLGTLIELGVFIFALFGAIRKFGVLEAKLNIMYGWFENSVLHQERKNDDRRTGFKDDARFYER